MGHRFDPRSGRSHVGTTKNKENLSLLDSDFSPSSLLEPTLIRRVCPHFSVKTVLLKVTENLHVSTVSACISVLSLGKPDAFHRLISLKHLVHVLPGYHTHLIFLLPLIDHSPPVLKKMEAYSFGPLLIFFVQQNPGEVFENTGYKYCIYADNSKIYLSSSVSPLTYFFNCFIER